MTDPVLDVTYGQVAVFDARLENPFNDWSETHVAQGFSWRPGSVSFATIDHDGPIAVRVTHGAARGARIDMARSMVVPFNVPLHGLVEIATITGSVPMHLAPGEYALTFEHGRPTASVMWASFHFAAVDVAVSPLIIIADSKLRPPAELLMSAKPA